MNVNAAKMPLAPFTFMPSMADSLFYMKLVHGVATSCRISKIAPQQMREV